MGTCELCKIYNEHTHNRTEVMVLKLCESCLHRLTIGELKKIAGEDFEEVLIEICKYL